MAGYSPEVHHSISVLTQDMLHRLKEGDQPTEAWALFDALQRAFPGDERQSRFYAALNELAGKVCKGG